MDLALAVDIGGTKLAAAVVDRDGLIHAQAALPTGSNADPEWLFERLCGLADGVRKAAGWPTIMVCGVGCGGPMAPGGSTVSPLNIPSWREFPLAARLADHMGLPTSVDNDAKALALAEGWRGRAAGCSNFLAMVVSTGVGGGIVLDGRLLDGDSGNAGHIGHVIVEPGGRLCGCGASGCLEAEASGLAIEALSGRPAKDAPPELRKRTGRMVGRAIGSVMNLLDLPLACVAGSVALGYGDDFFAAANEELQATAKLTFSRAGQIVPAGLGADGPLIGAAAVGWRSIAG